MKELTPNESLIVNKIYHIRGMQVMLDFDLAELFDVETKVLKQQVKRNMERFPEDFMFELTQDEFDGLRSQIVTSKRGGTRYLPYVFTEQGVAMLSGILRSKTAIEVNIKIMRVFVKMRFLISTHQEILQKIEQLEAENIEQNIQIASIYEIIKELIEPKYKNRKQIGFKIKE
ncbi:MAG: ORF6N domain-containing protein [Bacteroidales bacterium]